MRFFLSFLCLAGALAFAGAAHAAEGRIGIAAPLEGPNQLLGEQIRDGARLAASDADAQVFVANDECSAEGGEAAALNLVSAGVALVVGFLCTEAIEAALPILSDAGIAAITPAVRSNGLTDRRQRAGWLVWRTAPRADAELAAVGTLLVRHWRNELFAIVDDGTIHGRELAESLRLAAELAGLKPVFVDTFRPQSENQIGLVGRLRRSGATHVFVGGDRDDVAIIARDAAGLDYDLVVGGGESLRAAGDVPLAAGTLMVATPEWSESASEDELAHFRQAGIFPDGYVAPAYAAMQVAAEAVEAAERQDVPLSDILSSTIFDTIAGPVSFNEHGDLAQGPFRLFRYEHGRFLPLE